jgi:hypothetical protein
VFPSSTDDDREIITIIGKKEAVEEAKAALQATIKDIVSYTSEYFTALFISFVLIFCRSL